MSKIEKFEIVFFFSILGVDKVFGDVLKSKQSTLEEKNVHLWMAKKLIFSKWINQGFCQKMDILKLFLFGKNKSREDVWRCSVQLTSHSRREKCRFVSGQKSWNFPKGSTYTFCKNWKTRLEKLFGDVLFDKQAIPDEKNVVFWIAKNYIFQRGEPIVLVKIVSF